MILFKSNNDPAIISHEKVSTYLETLSYSKFISQEFLSGLKNERIITSDNSPYDFIISLLSIWSSGNIPVVINPNFTKEQQTDLIKELDIKINFSELTKSIRTKSAAITNSGDFDLKIHSSKNSALILFTSGSTSKPKAVELTFANLINNSHCINSLVPIKSNEKFGLTLPFYHIGGFQIIFRALFSGNAIVIPASFKSIDIFNSVQSQLVNYISIVSKTLFDFLESDYQFHDGLKAIFLGGGFSNPTTVKKAIEKRMKIYKVYGSTETTSMITGFNCNKHIDKIDSAGTPLFDVKIKLDKEGHILLKSDSLMKGYINYPNSYREKGWFNTFDYGHLDSEGYLYIDSRREDMIVSGGENINLIEVNNLITSHPSIVSAFSFGREDEKWGQILCAAVILKSGTNLTGGEKIPNHLDEGVRLSGIKLTDEEKSRKQLNAKIPTEEEIKDYLKKQTVSYKIPKRIYFLDKFPVTELGKIKREELLKIIDSYEI
ncbi:MAG: AMP-binding protein [Ignavibacteriaceae bacterium]|jgi:O-succinylbenzoic acid--CoA ligase|nr:AMP-binding protein [Ignavibacteriaceae bacterium]